MPKLPWSIEELLAHQDLGLLDKSVDDRKEIAESWGWDYEELIKAVVEYREEN